MGRSYSHDLRERVVGFVEAGHSQVEATPDITMPELAARMAAATGMKADPAVLSRFLCRLGFTYKKGADGVGMRTRGRP
ncbi:ISSpo6, transposase orf A [Bosea sp. LC85]|nr:ISSpo6, transposase orf A [Bosea sp. LC85]